MYPVRGRPRKVDSERMKEAILRYREIINNNNNIVSKKHDIWKTIARELGNNVTSDSLYVFTMCNRYDVKNEIFNKVICNDNSMSTNESLLCDTLEVNNTCISSSPDHSFSENFIIPFLREDFKNVLTEKVYKRRVNGKAKMYYRLRKVLQPGKWQELITHKFWEATKMTCGFQFKNHYISTDAKSGVINGKRLL